MVSLYINQQRIGEVVVLDLKGRTNVRGTTVDLYRAIRCLVDEGKNRILLNLSGVTHIDSVGLGELVSCHLSARSRGGIIKLAHLTEQVAQLMEITKLSTVFDVYDDESKALSSFSVQKLKIVEQPSFG